MVRSVLGTGLARRQKGSTSEMMVQTSRVSTPGTHEGQRWTPPLSPLYPQGGPGLEAQHLSASNCDANIRAQR